MIILVFMLFVEIVSLEWSPSIVDWEQNKLIQSGNCFQTDADISLDDGSRYDLGAGPLSDVDRRRILLGSSTF